MQQTKHGAKPRYDRKDLEKSEERETWYYLLHINGRHTKSNGKPMETAFRELTFGGEKIELKVTKKSRTLDPTSLLANLLQLNRYL